MKHRKLNSAQKNYQKQYVKSLHDQRTTERGKMVGWVILGLLLLPTIIVPYVAYGYVKKAKQRRIELLETIKSMSPP